MKTILQKGIKVVLGTGAVYGLVELAYLMGEGVMLGVMLEAFGCSAADLDGRLRCKKYSFVNDARLAFVKSTAKQVIKRKD